MNDPTDMPDAVVVIVTYNSACDIAICVQSLDAHFPLLEPGQAQVHVVDNASTDDTPAILEGLAKTYPWLRLHLQTENLGFGPGNNVVLNSVPARAHILLNADAYLVADSLSPALEHLSHRHDIGVLGLPLVYPDGSPQTYAFRYSSWHRWLLHVLGARHLAKSFLGVAPLRGLMARLPYTRSFAQNHGVARLDLDDARALTSSQTLQARPAEWVAGAIMVLTPGFLTASGGFDPDIFLYGEDEDLCIQARKLGYRVMTLATTPIVHVLGWGGATNFRPFVAGLKYNSLKYFIRKDVDGTVNKMLMRLILPFYVYGRNIRHLWSKGG